MTGLGVKTIDFGKYIVYLLGVKYFVSLGCRKVGSNVQQLVCFTVELIKWKESKGKL